MLARSGALGLALARRRADLRAGELTVYAADATRPQDRYDFDYGVPALIGLELWRPGLREARRDIFSGVAPVDWLAQTLLRELESVPNSVLLLQTHAGLVSGAIKAPATRIGDYELMFARSGRAGALDRTKRWSTYTFYVANWPAGPGGAWSRIADDELDTLAGAVTLAAVEVYEYDSFAVWQRRGS